MPNKKKKAKDRAIVVSVTIPPRILTDSQVKAFYQNQTYSAYIVGLIRKDLENA
jgi:hypothetical protein